MFHRVPVKQVPPRERERGRGRGVDPWLDEHHKSRKWAKRKRAVAPVKAKCRERMRDFQEKGRDQGSRYAFWDKFAAEARSAMRDKSYLHALIGVYWDVSVVAYTPARIKKSLAYIGRSMRMMIMIEDLALVARGLNGERERDGGKEGGECGQVYGRAKQHTHVNI